MIPTCSSRFRSYVVPSLLAPAVIVSLWQTFAGAQAAKPALDFDQLIKDKSYLQLEAALKTPRAEKLTKTERDYFAGVVANRRNRLQESIALLVPLVDVLPVPAGGSPTEVQPTAGLSLTPERQKIAWRALGDSYTKLFRYPDAAAAYDRAERFASAATEEERHDLRLEREFRDLMRNQPTQTVSLDGGFIVEGRRSKIGLLEIVVEASTPALSTEARSHGEKGDKADRGGAVNQKSHEGHAKEEDWWIVDTGANFSTITRSTAQRLGLKLSEGTTHVRGITGAESKLHLAVIPELRIGKAAIRNVAVLVLDDQNLYLPPVKHQIHGIIGAPVLMVLERITFFADGRFGIRLPASSSIRSTANMMMDELTPLVEASTFSSGQRLLFSFDTGANRSAFYSRYYNERRPEFAKAKRTKRSYGGAGGVKVSEAYRLENIPMEICGGKLTLPAVDVNTEPTKKTEPEFYGNLGQDILTPFRSLTIDFTAMRCSVD